jgi:radical SAM protein with 4Fe4S-binding SPASM domain
MIYLCDLITSGRSEGEEDARISAEQWRELADFIIDDITDPESSFEYDIGAMPSFIAYAAETLLARGYDITRGLERLKVVTACPVGKGHMNINSEGGVMPCQFAQDWTIGNIRDLGIDGATRELFKLAEAKPKGKCGDCDYVEICVGCRTKAWHAEGDPMAEDPTCMLDPEFQHGELLIRKALSCCAPGGCS